MTARPAMSRPMATSRGWRGLVGLGRGQDVAQGDQLAVLVGHLDADGRRARDGGQDAHVGRRHGVGDVLGQAGDPGHLDAGPELELVAGHRRADGHADQPGLDPVGGQGVLQGPALRPRPAACRPRPALARFSRATGGSRHVPCWAAGPRAIDSCSAPGAGDRPSGRPRPRPRGSRLRRRRRRPAAGVDRRRRPASASAVAPRRRRRRGASGRQRRGVAAGWRSAPRLRSALGRSSPASGSPADARARAAGAATGGQVAGLARPACRSGSAATTADQRRSSTMPAPQGAEDRRAAGLPTDGPDAARRPTDSVGRRRRPARPSSCGRAAAARCSEPADRRRAARSRRGRPGPAPRRGAGPGSSDDRRPRPGTGGTRQPAPAEQVAGGRPDAPWPAGPARST